MLPKLGIHADPGKARHSINFTDKNLLFPLPVKKINSSQAAAFYCLKGKYSVFPYLLPDLRFQGRGNDQLGTIVDVLCPVIIKITAGDNLPGYGRNRVIPSQDAAFYFRPSIKVSTIAFRS